jgi:hypothetical protein
MRPVLGREIVESKQRFLILLKTFAGFGEFDLITGNELFVGCQSGFAGRRSTKRATLVRPIVFAFIDCPLTNLSHQGPGSRIATLTMVFKLTLEAQKHWRRLQGFQLIPKVITGVPFIDGEELTQQAA